MMDLLETELDGHIKGKISLNIKFANKHMNQLDSNIKILWNKSVVIALKSALILGIT